MLQLIMIIIFIRSKLVKTSISAFDDCLEDNGQLITDTICRPVNYIDTDLPRIPMIIKSTLVMEGIRDVDEKSMTITLTLWLNINWIDNKLIGNQTNDPGFEHIKFGKNGQFKKIWHPEIETQNLVDFKLITMEHQLEFFLQNLEGQVEVLMTFHGTYTIGCPMDYSHFPFDTQRCEIIIGTDSFTSDLLTFESAKVDLDHGGKKNDRFQQYQVELQA